jgi:hypothetical protein
VDAGKVNVGAAALAHEISAMCHVVGVGFQQACGQETKAVRKSGVVSFGLFM